MLHGKEDALDSGTSQTSRLPEAASLPEAGQKGSPQGVLRNGIEPGVPRDR